MFPGVLDLALDSPDESNISEVEDVIVDDIDIGALVHHKPANIQPDYSDFREAKEGDLINCIKAMQKEANEGCDT